MVVRCTRSDGDPADLFAVRLIWYVAGAKKKGGRVITGVEPSPVTLNRTPSAPGFCGAISTVAVAPRCRSTTAGRTRLETM